MVARNILPAVATVFQRTSPMIVLIVEKVPKLKKIVMEIFEELGINEVTYKAWVSVVFDG